MEYYRITPIWNQLYGIRQILRQFQEFGRISIAEVTEQPRAKSASKENQLYGGIRGFRSRFICNSRRSGKTRYFRRPPPRQ